MNSNQINNNQGTNNNIKTETKGRGLFYGVIAIATFIIMAVGATFAYFTATTESMDSSVQTGSTTLQLQYISYGNAWMKKDLIPADTVVVEYSVEEQNDASINTDPDTGSPANEDGVYPENGNNTMCKDDYGNSICSIYVFQVKNSSNSPQYVALNVVSETNTFANLYSMAYEIAVPTEQDALEQYNKVYDADDETLKTEKNGRNDPAFRTNQEDSVGKVDVSDGKGQLIFDYTPVYINRAGTVKTLLKYTSIEQGSQLVTKKPAIEREIKKIEDPLNLEDVDKRTAKIADDIEIEGGETKTFAIVLYILNDRNKDQTNEDAEKTFTGHVTVTSGDGGTGVSGQIGLATEDAKNNLQSNKNTSEDTE